MPDDNRVIRGINFRETFPFTHLFRSFRVAIHPSKLVLAVTAILVLYIGGRVMDGIWPESHRGVPAEVNLFENTRNERIRAAEAVGADARAEVPELPEFSKRREAARDQIIKEYGDILVHGEVPGDDGKPLAPDKAQEAAKAGKYLGHLKDRLIDERDKRVARAEERHKIEKDSARAGTLAPVQAALDQYYGAVEGAEAQRKAAIEAADKLTDASAKDAAKKKAFEDEAKAKSDAGKKKDEALKLAKDAQEAHEKSLKGDDLAKEEKRKEDDIKKEALAYQKEQRGNYDGSAMIWRRAERIEGRGLWSLFMDYEVDRINDVVTGVTHNNWFGGLMRAEPGAPAAAAANLEPGVFESAYRFFCVGPRWAISIHPIYFTLFGILFLIVWSLFGGAIARIAAVHVAREEKISIRQALKFSGGKFLSFVFAPIIPVAIIAVLGVIVAVGGLLINIPYVGEILVGVFYFLALAAGFVMTLVTLGAIGGMNLMYPTIAVEGSDSFDAISRSFSYVYARPWRMLWYTVVSIAYGAFTFLFIRLFVFLMLAFAHRFTGMWVVRSGPGGQSVWDAIWPGPSFWHLPYEINSISLTYGQRIAAFFVAAWVFLTIAFLGAFVISFYFSSSTIIYYLMRREVDATELDDVFIEQSDEEFAEPAPATTTATQGTAATPAPAPALVVPSVEGAQPPVIVEGGNPAPPPHE